jgi:Zn-dependent protease/predicted transcriptional regulator
MCHSLVARKTGMPVAGITLWIFGGVSELEDEPPTAGSEFLMAVVGPVSSCIIGFVCLVLWIVGRSAGWSAALQSVVIYLAAVNFVLAVFNSFPAFPLDGGRVLRSVVWGITGDLGLATQVAVSIGSLLGLGMMFVGILLFMWGPIVGLWLVVLGFFVRQAAFSNLQFVTMRRYLEGETVRRLMTMDVVVVPRDLTLQQFVEELVFRHRFRHYPVVDGNGYLVGMASAHGPRAVRPEQWPHTTVREIMTEVHPDSMLSPDSDALAALSVLRRLRGGYAVVVEDGRPVGIVSMGDISAFLALKAALDPQRGRSGR